MIRVEQHDQVAVVKLDRGVTNALNLPLVQELAGVLQQVKDDPAARAVVLGSANDKFFSIGLDLPTLCELPREDLGSFFQAYSQMCLDLYTLPKPTIAAITGHALAGGCIVTLCCDARFIAAGRKLMGLNEIKLGIPVPYLADCILRDLVGVRNAREIMELGEFYPPEELRQLGLVDRVLSLEEVLPQAIERAAVLGALPQEAFAAIKRNRVETIAAHFQAHGEEKDQVLAALWFTEDTQKRLREAAKKF